MKININQSEIDRIYALLDAKMIESGKAIEQTAKNICPVKSGELQKDIQTDYNDGEKKAYIYNTLDYAPYVNLGTRKQTANPYLEVALYSTDLTSIWS